MPLTKPQSQTIDAHFAANLMFRSGIDHDAIHETRRIASIWLVTHPLYPLHLVGKEPFVLALE